MSDTPNEELDFRALDARLRALARHLVHDPQAAEDVVQEAWMAALDRPRGAVQELGAWLAGVVRNLAFRRARRERARADAEAFAALRAESGDDHDKDDEPSAALELRSAADELREPLRSVIFAHYFEGRTLAETAETLGRPLETVRTQRRRALAELRATLDRRRAGDRKQWLVLLARFGGQRAPKHVKLRTTWVAALALVPLTLGVLWWALRAPEAPAAVARADTAPLRERNDAIVDLGAPTPSSRAPAEPEAPAAPVEVAPATPVAEPPQRFLCTVLDGEGKPIAGAAVVATLAEGQAAGPYFADANGLAIVEVPRDRLARTGRFVEHGGISVYAIFKGRARSLISIVPATREDREVVLRIDEPGQKLTGIVLDEDGQPIADARIELDHALKRFIPVGDGIVQMEDMPRTKTDAAGTFKIGFLPRREHRWVARAEGFAAATGAVAADADEVEATIVLSRGRTIGGRVRLANGAPAANARVWIAETAGASVGSPHASTDSDGRYEFAGVSDDRTRVFARAAPPLDEFADALFEFEPASERGELDFELAFRAPLEIRLVDAQGRPYPGALAIVETRLGDPSPWRQGAGFDTDGIARYANYPSCPLALEVVLRESSGAAARRTFDPRETTKLEIELEDTLDKTTPIFGFVTGSPAGLAKVRVLAVGKLDGSQLYGGVDPVTGAIEPMRLPPREFAFFAADEHGVLPLGAAHVDGGPVDLGSHEFGPPRELHFDWTGIDGVNLAWSLRARLPGLEPLTTERLFDPAFGRAAFALRDGEYVLVGREPSGQTHTTLEFEVTAQGATKPRVR